VFKSLEKHSVKYVVIGGIASVIHGVPRATFDLDILIEADEGNVKNLLAAFLDAGLATADLITPEELLKNEITVFNDSVRIDVQTFTPGLIFREAWENKDAVKNQDYTLFVLSREDLIKSKTAAGRQADIEDVRILQNNEKPG
jgi:predicted nucleotidyltransferase